MILGVVQFCANQTKIFIFCASFVDNSENFDTLHGILPVNIAKLYNFKYPCLTYVLQSNFSEFRGVIKINAN